jgi:hypothetical protein
MTGDFDDVIEQSHTALGQIARGDASGYKALYSRREDITLGNPFGGFGRGWGPSCRADGACRLVLHRREDD